MGRENIRRKVDQGRSWKCSILEPATGKELGRLGRASVSDVAAATSVAKSAQVEWANLTFSDRAAVLRRPASYLKSTRRDHEWNMRETGAINPKGGLEVHIAAQECYEAASLASHPTGEILRSELPRLSFSRRVPVGVVGVIAPFNFL